jgi:hypothetical protein
MSVDRIQPRNAINPLWDKEAGTAAAAAKKASAAPAATTSPAKTTAPKEPINRSLEGAATGNTASTAKATKPAKTNIWGDISKESLSRLHAVSEKLQAVGDQSKINQQISSVGQDIVVTQQELDAAARTQNTVTVGTSNSGDSSYWDKLSVTEKARTINQLKDKLQKMELEQSQLQSQLSESINSGTYSVSGEEIVSGIQQT